METQDEEGHWDDWIYIFEVALKPDARRPQIVSWVQFLKSEADGIGQLCNGASNLQFSEITEKGNIKRDAYAHAALVRALRNTRDAPRSETPAIRAVLDVFGRRSRHLSHPMFLVLPELGCYVRDGGSGELLCWEDGRVTRVPESNSSELIKWARDEGIACGVDLCVNELRKSGLPLTRDGDIAVRCFEDA